MTRRPRTRDFPKPIDYVLLILIGLCMLAYWAMADAAQAQPNTLSFNASTTTGDGQVVTTVEWSTSPPAPGDTPCTATGAPEWAGPKAGSGMQQLTLASSVTLNIECTWPGDSIATTSWTNPATNTDGSPYTDRQSTIIRWRLDADPRDDRGAGPINSRGALLAPPSGGGIVELDPTWTMHTITGLTGVGEYRFAAFACNQRDVCSDASNLAMKSFTGLVTATESVGIVVNPIPSVISGLSVE